MENEHTPGPWWPCQNSAGVWWVATYRDGETASSHRVRDTGATICGNIGDHTAARTNGNEEANARLIAAAPDLLEALEYLLEQTVVQDERYNCIITEGEAEAAAMARAAIAKARGAS